MASLLGLGQGALVLRGLTAEVHDAPCIQGLLLANEGCIQRLIRPEDDGGLDGAGRQEIGEEQLVMHVYLSPAKGQRTAQQLGGPTVAVLVEPPQ